MGYYFPLFLTDVFVTSCKGGSPIPLTVKNASSIIYTINMYYGIFCYVSKLIQKIMKEVIYEKIDTLDEKSLPDF